MTLMLGLSLALSAVSVSFADDAPAPTKKKKKGKETDPLSSCCQHSLGSFERLSTPRSLLLGARGLRGVVIFLRLTPSSVFLISSWMQGLASSSNEHFRER